MATIESVKRETATEAAIRGLEKYIIQRYILGDLEQSKL